MVPTIEMRSRSPHPTPLSSCIAALKVKSQPEDSQHIGPKYVVVYLLYYWVKYSCVRLYV